VKKSDQGNARAGLYGPLELGTIVPALDMEEALLESPSSSEVRGGCRPSSEDRGGCRLSSSKSGGGGGRDDNLAFAKDRERSDMVLQPESSICSLDRDHMSKALVSLGYNGDSLMFDMVA
jgi:hypothetical protein